VIVSCIYDLSSVIAIRTRQGIPRQQASTRPRHALPLPLPAPRYGAGMLPRPLCHRGLRPPPRASSPQLRRRRVARRYGGGGRAAVAATPHGAPFAETVRPSRDPCPPDKLPTMTACEPVADGDSKIQYEARHGCRRGGGRATAAARRTGQVPQTVARKHTDTHTPLPPHGERVAVAAQCRRPAGVPPRPRHRCTDHLHVGRKKCLEGARPRQWRGGRRLRAPAGRGRGTPPLHTPRGWRGSSTRPSPPPPPTGRRRPLGWRLCGWWGTRRVKPRLAGGHLFASDSQTTKF